MDISPSASLPILDLPEYLTIDMVHQYAYCPRRMQLMYVDGRWDDNIFTEQGRSVHTRVDSEQDPLPPADGDPEPVIARSVSLSSPLLRLSGKLDLREVGDGQAIPVETKRGSPPDNEERSYEPERIQLMCQALLLREHNHTSNHGMLYFAAARKRVRVEFTPALEARALHIINEVRALIITKELLPPLLDSPKCYGCSLVGICLPDETNLLIGRTEKNAEETMDIRRLYPARDDALPLYIQEQGARVGKKGEAVTVSKGKELLGSFPLKDVSQLVLCGNISLSAQCLHLLCERGIPVVHLSMGNWFYGVTFGISLKNAYARASQFTTASDEAKSLAIAKAFIEAKTRNQRTLLRRNARSSVEKTLSEMKKSIDRIERCKNTEELVGLEGSIAALYFSEWGKMLAENSPTNTFFHNLRNRRPPKDPVNAMLSFGYALLVKEITVALMSEGLDPFWGFLHRPRHGKPALALDLMEEFRPLIIDSSVISAINNRMVEAKDFIVGSAGCSMKDTARKAFIKAYELRLDQMITHPIFDYRCSWRSVIRVQARLLSKTLRGEIPGYIGITTR